MRALGRRVDVDLGENGDLVVGVKVTGQGGAELAVQP